MAWRRMGGDSPHLVTHDGRSRSWLVLGAVAVPALLWGGLIARRTDVENSAAADAARTWAGLGAVAAAFLVAYAIGRIRNRPLEHVRAASAAVLTAEAAAHPVLVHPVVQTGRRSVHLRLEVSDEHDVLLGHVEVHPLPGFDPRAPWWLVGDPTPGRPVALVAESQHQVVLASTLLSAGPAPASPWSEHLVALVGWGEDAEHPTATAASLDPTAPAAPPTLDLLEHPVARWRRARTRWRRLFVVVVLVAFAGPIAVEVPTWAPLLLLVAPGPPAWIRLRRLRRQVLELAGRREPDLDLSTRAGRLGATAARALLGWGRPPSAPPTWTGRLPLATR